MRFEYRDYRYGNSYNVFRNSTYDFAGQIREKSISKGGYQFVYAQHLNSTLQQIDAMPQSMLEEIIMKYLGLAENSDRAAASPD